MKKLLSVLLVAMLILSMVPTSVFAAKAETISTLDLTVTAPAAGEKPSYNKIEGRGYYSDNGLHGTSTRIFKNGIAWYKSASSYFSPGTTATFEANKTYTVKITLTAKENFSFAANVTAKINGKSATVDSFDDGSIMVETTLTATKAPEAITSVSLNVVNPVINKTPTYAKVDTAQYFSEKYGTVSNCTNGVTWTNQSNGINITINNPFKEGAKYKVSYYLTAKTGYKFTSNTACTINGSTASISLTDSTHAIVSLSNLVPGDGKRVVDSLSLNITAPADGAKPSYDKIDGTGYYSDNGINGVSTRIYKNGIAWYKSASSFISPGTTETFAGGTNYILKIALTPKDGYKFADNVTAKINGKSATVERFDDGSINASVTLTATKKGHTHTASGWKNDEGYHWKVCTDSTCGSLIGDKVAHTDSNKDNKCDVCGYQKAVSTPEGTTNEVTSTTQTPAEETTSKNTASAQKPDNTETNNTDDTEDTDIPTDEATDTEDAVDAETTGTQASDQEDGGNALLWIILGAVLVLAAGSVVTFIVLKKKKQAK